MHSPRQSRPRRRRGDWGVPPGVRRGKAQLLGQVRYQVKLGNEDRRNRHSRESMESRGMPNNSPLVEGGPRGMPNNSPLVEGGSRGMFALPASSTDH